MSRNFLERIQQYGSFSEDDETLISQFLIRKSIKKNELVQAEGEVCQSCYFVESGSLRQFKDVDGFTQQTINLFLENDFVLDQSSFTSQKPSLFNVQALEDCELIELTIHSIHSLITMSPTFFALGKILDANTHMNYAHLKSPEEKYLALIQNRPQVIQRFPLKYIASYLGMTPETLSRVRAKVKF
jgi:CRP-like cAMP-binding protein